MELLHTSPDLITKITKQGRFKEFLFFSSSKYVMTAGQHVTYKTEVNEDEIIDASSLFYHEDAAKLNTLVAQVAGRFSVDEDTAEQIIDQTLNVWDLELDLDSEALAEASWAQQTYSAIAGKILGYRAISMKDEQGTAYMIDMLEKESDLVLM